MGRVRWFCGKLKDTPEGSPLCVRVTPEAKPLKEKRVTVEDPWSPGTMPRVIGETEIAKSCEAVTGETCRTNA